MKIAQLTPGSGDQFYCENCLRDGALVRAMRRNGHDVVLVPMYLPLEGLRTEVDPTTPIFFGGVNVYLQQKWSLFRRTPRWVDRWLDSPRLLEKVGKRAGMTNARDLGETTVSILQGDEGRQIKELNRLLEWLKLPEHRPDLVCLSNILLAGLAGPIRRQLRVPVVCLLQDEDGFLDGLAEPWKSQAWDILARRAAELDGFIAVSEYYGETMRDRLKLPEARIDVVYTGIELDGYHPADTPPAVPTIGFLSQMCEAKGLDTLIQAFVILRKDNRLANIRLRIAGGSSAADEAFMKRIKREIKCWELRPYVEILDTFDKPQRQEFLRSLTVLTVPEKQPVAYGLYVLEALACGVPVVEPWHGVFGELLEFTGGGVLYQPNNAANLAEALKPLLLDPSQARELGGWGRDAIINRFNIDHTVDDLARVYKDIVLEFDVAPPVESAERKEGD